VVLAPPLALHAGIATRTIPADVGRAGVATEVTLSRSLTFDQGSPMSVFRPLVAAAALVTLLAPSAQAQAKAHLVVIGGPKAGQYDASATSGGCSSGAVGKGAFGVQLGNPKGEADRFNSVQLVVPSPFASGSSAFLLQIGFGPLRHSTVLYTVETRPGQPKMAGSGTVTVTDDGGSNASVTFEVTAADGTMLSGTVTCQGVTRM
jgi:hypothetical protein